jgi:hypothetical protein
MCWLCGDVSRRLFGSGGGHGASLGGLNKENAMNNVTELPRDFTMNAVEMDGRKWWLTEKVLNDKVLYRRLVLTQIGELLALYKLYPLPDLDEVGHILHRLRKAYDDVALFDRPLLADV